MARNQSRKGRACRASTPNDLHGLTHVPPSTSSSSKSSAPLLPTAAIWSADIVPFLSAPPIGASRVNAQYFSTERYNMDTKISVSKYYLQRVEDEIRDAESALNDRKSIEHGLQERLESMEKEIEERVNRRGAVTVDALVAQAAEGLSSRAQAHYDDILTLHSRYTPESLIEFSSSSRGAGYEPSGLYKAFLNRPLGSIPTHEGKRPSCLSAPQAQYTDLGTYLDPIPGQWGPSFPRTPDQMIIPGSPDTKDYLLLILHTDQVRTLDMYLSALKSSKTPVTTYEVWLPRASENGELEYQGTYEFDDKTGTLPFTRLVTGYLPTLYAGHPEIGTVDVRWTKQRIAWNKRQNDYVFRVLKYVSFNRVFFDTLEQLPPVARSRKRTRDETSGTEGMELAFKVARL